MVSNNFDPTNLSERYELGMKDSDGSGITSSSELRDHEMIQEQKQWLNRLSNTFNVVVGLLGGMALLSFILMYGLVTNVETLKGSIDYVFSFITAC